MYKFIGTFLLFAIFLSGSAFSTAASSPAPTKATQLNSPKGILSATVTQTGPGQITATWTTTWGGQVMLNLYNPANQIIRQVFTNNTSFTFSGLTVGQSYRVAIKDNNTTWLSSLILITF